MKKPTLPIVPYVDSVNLASNEEVDLVASRIKRKHRMQCAMIPLICVDDSPPDMFRPDEWVTAGTFYWLMAVSKPLGFGNIRDANRMEEAQAQATTVTAEAPQVKPAVPLAIHIAEMGTMRPIIPSERFKAFSDSRFRVFAPTGQGGGEIYIN